MSGHGNERPYNKKTWICVGVGPACSILYSSTARVEHDLRWHWCDTTERIVSQCFWHQRIKLFGIMAGVVVGKKGQQVIGAYQMNPISISNLPDRQHKSFDFKPNGWHFFHFQTGSNDTASTRRRTLVLVHVGCSTDRPPDRRNMHTGTLRYLVSLPSTAC